VAINTNFKKMNIENPGVVSESNEDKKTKRKRLFRRVMAGISSAIAIMMATNAFADGKAVKNKVIIDGKDKSQVATSDAGIVRPEISTADVDLGGKLAKEGAEVIGNNEKDPKDRIYNNPEEMAREMGGIAVDGENLAKKSGIN
jgi:hypothetical protein